MQVLYVTCKYFSITRETQGSTEHNKSENVSLCHCRSFAVSFSIQTTISLHYAKSCMLVSPASCSPFMPCHASQHAHSLFVGLYLCLCGSPCRLPWFCYIEQNHAVYLLNLHCIEVTDCFTTCTDLPLLFLPITGRNEPLKKDRPKWKSDYPMTEGQLRSKRDEFWDTAPAFEGRKEIWDALKAAAVALECNDHELAQAIVDGASITLPHGEDRKHAHHKNTCFFTRI